MFGDRRADTRSYAHIEQVAERARSAGQLSGYSRFNIIEYLEGTLKHNFRHALEFKVFEKGEYTVPAFVKLRPNNDVMLYSERSVWRGAAAGMAEPKFIIAHEIGHIHLHRHDELAFSASIPSLIAKLPDTDRTEPQAVLFADLFLVPTSLLTGFTCIDDIMYFFDVPYECASRRYEFVIDKRRRLLARSYVGEVCPKCANFTLVRNGTCLKCDTCGSTTGCS